MNSNLKFFKTNLPSEFLQEVLGLIVLKGLTGVLKPKTPHLSLETKDHESHLGLNN